MMQTIIRPNASTRFAAGGTTLLIEDPSNGNGLRFEFGELPAEFGELPAGVAVDQLDKLAAGALEIRGRLLRELATDEDA